MVRVVAIEDCSRKLASHLTPKVQHPIASIQADFPELALNGASPPDAHSNVVL
jgi:hypothetical protein